MSANRWRETWLRGCLELLDWGNHGEDGEMELKLTLNGDAECLVVGLLGMLTGHYCSGLLEILLLTVFDHMRLMESWPFPLWEFRVAGVY